MMRCTSSFALVEVQRHQRHDALPACRGVLRAQLLLCATTFPVQERCPKCSAGEMSEVLLPRRGTLVAWTTQGFPPGPPYKGPVGKDFVPFGVGLVQLDDVIRVEGRLTENDPAKLQFGQEVELTMMPFAVDDDGNEIITFAFQPV